MKQQGIQWYVGLVVLSIMSATVRPDFLIDHLTDMSVGWTAEEAGTGEQEPDSEPCEKRGNPQRNLEEEHKSWCHGHVWCLDDGSNGLHAHMHLDEDDPSLNHHPTILIPPPEHV